MLHTERSRLTLIVTVISVENVMGHNSLFVKVNPPPFALPPTTFTLPHQMTLPLQVKESDPPLFGERFSQSTGVLETQGKSTLVWREQLTGAAGVKFNTRMSPSNFSSILPSVLRFSLRSNRDGAAVTRVGVAELNLFRDRVSLADMCDRQGLNARLFLEHSRCLEFGVWGLGFRVWGLGFWI